MGKQGPCRHCGVTSTPIWRNGPPEKPVLCNACGSRWRTKGSLTNYTPLHARAPLDSEEFRVSKPKNACLKPPKEQKSYKKRQNHSLVETEHEMTYSGQNFRKIFEVDSSNRSSSGSVISYSESCAHFGTADASDLAGSVQSNVWDSLVPSKKRTDVIHPKPSPVEKLTEDLHSIMHEQSSYFSVSSEDLLYECGTPMSSFEMGHGGVLIKCLSSKNVEEESVASSLPIDNKSHNISEFYSGSPPFPLNSEKKGGGYSNVVMEKHKKPEAQLTPEQLRRDKISHEKLDLLRDRDSPLSSIDLEDITSFEVFMKHMTLEEQQRLVRYLPSVDTANSTESLKSMFRSSYFVENMSFFQQLLLEGIFDTSFVRANGEESRTLKRLVLHNSTKSKWMEHYKKLKIAKHKQILGGKEIAPAPRLKVLRHSNLAPLKRPRDCQNKHYQGLKGAMRSPKRVPKFADMNLSSAKLSQLNYSEAGSKLINESDDFMDNEGVCFSPTSIFASPPDRSSMLVSLQLTDESTDHDLLLDVPSDASFPEAELLFHPWNSKTAQNSSLTESVVAVGEENLFNNPSLSFGSRNQRFQH